MSQADCDSRRQHRVIAGTLSCLLLASFGALAASLQPLVIGGSPVRSGALPWMVTLVYPSAPSAANGVACGGTLVRPQWVLTAAHCLADESGTVNATPDLDVVIGRADLTTDDGARMSPDFLVTYPDWEPYGPPWTLPPRNDLLLLHLPEPINGVAPVRLPGQTYDDFVVTDGEKAIGAGWGVTSRSRYRTSAVLNYAELPIVSQGLCRAAEPSLPVLDTTLCAGPSDGSRDTCAGDSGGPLLVTRGGDSHWMQVGITSYGQNGCASTSQYGVYTRVSRYAQWISDTACTQEERPARPALRLSVEGQTATAGFDPVANAGGYRLYYAPAPGMAPIDQIDLEDATSFSATLASGTDLYVAVQAYDGICLSPYSDILRLTIP